MIIILPIRYRFVSVSHPRRRLTTRHLYITSTTTIITTTAAEAGPVRPVPILPDTVQVPHPPPTCYIGTYIILL